MKAVLSENLPLISTAPGGIRKLRDLILVLAVRGKLVSQDAHDEPASELLKRIVQQRAQREESGTRSKSGATLRQDVENWPYEIPSTWIWARFREVFSLEYGDSLPAPKRTESGEFPVYGSNGVVGTHSAAMVSSPCIVVGRKGSAGALNLCRERGCWVTDVAYYCVPSAEMDLDFVFMLFHTLGLAELGKGIKPGLSRSETYGILVAIPPLAEQQRIVSKVDELMALCDRLEEEQTDADDAHAKLVDALLGTLVQSADAADLASNWHRVADHFESFFTTESSIDALKQTILHLAVLRKLGGGDTERWTVERLDDVCSKIVDCPHSTPEWTSAGKICVRTNQFSPGKLDLSSSRFVSESTYTERTSRLKPHAGDVLYSREGGILGVACRVPPDVELCLGQRMMLIRPDSTVDPAFLELVLNSPIITTLARQNTIGGAAPRINVATVKAFPIPVPPLAEQHRIVSKVGQLTALCDRLKAELRESNSRQELLAATLIESSLKAA